MSYLFGGTPFDGHSRDGRRTLNMGGGGGGGPTTTTNQTSNIPDWLRPQVEAAIGASTQQLFNTTQNADGTQTLTGLRGYTPYSANPTDYVAGFAPMQNQAFQSAANLQTPGQFGAGSDLAAAAGQGALGTTGAAMGYGNAGYQAGQQGANIGQAGIGYGQAGYQAGLAGQGIGTSQGLGYGAMGAGYGQQGAGTAQTALGYGQGAANLGAQASQAGANYQQMATNPNSIQAYMNPYVEASMAPQLQLMNQQLAQTQAQNQAQAVKQGAYGGSRQAVQQGLTQQNSDLAKQQLIAQGYNEAFKNAQQAQQYGSTLGLQGMQAGIQGQQAALQGVQGAQAGYAQGIQGAQAGLQGVNAALAGTAQGMQGAQTGISGVNAGLQGNAQALQGAQVGLQGVQGAQAGYGLANTAAGQLGQLGAQQLAAQQGIIGLQNQLGSQQQAQEQQYINNAINNYAMAQNYPQQQLAFYNSMIRGYATPTTSTSQYQAAPSAVSQLGGLGATALGAYGASGGFKAAKKGGIMKASDGLDDIGMYLAMKGKK